MLKVKIKFTKASLLLTKINSRVVSSVQSLHGAFLSTVVAHFLDPRLFLHSNAVKTTVYYFPRKPLLIYQTSVKH